MNAKKVVAYNINRLIEANKTSQAELARSIDTEPLTIHNYIKAKRFPKAENLDKIAKHFNVTLSDLFKDPFAANISPEMALAELASHMGYEIKKKN